MIYIGADHRGFRLKEYLKTHLAESGEPFEDIGNAVFDPDDDYPDFAAAVSQKVSQNPAYDRGIVICGSGIGMAAAADKFRGIRAGLCTSVKIAEMGRRDDDINVLSLAADFTDEATAKEIVKVFLETAFSGEERHKRRLEKIAMIES
jgi:ribose 5-phosphate isomerase B